MFAIIRTGGKQYKVAKDDKITVEKIEGKAGDKVKLDQVLYANDGKKALSGATVTAEIAEQFRAPKITIFKKKRRQNYRRKNGHRQPQTLIKILDVKAAA